MGFIIMEANRKMIETLIDYSFEQALASRKLIVEDFFAKSMLKEFKL
jgi:hypothetical protein